MYRISFVSTLLEILQNANLFHKIVHSKNAFQAIGYYFKTIFSLFCCTDILFAKHYKVLHRLCHKKYYIDLCSNIILTIDR